MEGSSRSLPSAGSLSKAHLELPKDLPLPSTRIPAPCVFVEDEAFQLRPDFSRPYLGRGLDADKRISNYYLRQARSFQSVEGGIASMSQSSSSRIINAVSSVLCNLDKSGIQFSLTSRGSVAHCTCTWASLNDSDRNRIQAISNSRVPLFAADKQYLDLYMGTEDSIDLVPKATPYSHQPYGYSFEKAVFTF
ncbi:hypothetical protein IscW_ISCW023026 [Ixodes scapularis]|uniref:Uncharacterized protein n=1 Tax=Ixodes scapularis TaxID=6945 RepID=B7QH22_IXOSC|nr:hypothetical protein IscW_ISCW023026 [Ixodes scapularis]|eukprot:XP_002414479.1 hypothetical protein IscW_ISCW023026 [Ixodes scapularis]